MLKSPCYTHAGDTFAERVAFLDRISTLLPDPEIEPGGQEADAEIAAFEMDDPLAVLTAFFLPERYPDKAFYEKAYGDVPDSAELVRRLGVAPVLEAMAPHLSGATIERVLMAGQAATTGGGVQPPLFEG